jgi:hypothetical protein
MGLRTDLDTEVRDKILCLCRLSKPCRPGARFLNTAFQTLHYPSLSNMEGRFLLSWTPWRDLVSIRALSPLKDKKRGSAETGPGTI